MFGKKKYQKLLNKYQMLKKEYKNLHRTTEITQSQLNNVQEIIKKHEIIDCVENKLNQKFYVCLSGTEADFTIELIATNQPVPTNRNPRLYASVSHILTKDIEWSKEKECKIHDVFAINENVGNGSLLIEALFRLINKLDSGFVVLIRGELANTDQKDFNKLAHFYKKHGFTVTFDADRTEGSIQKTL